MVIKRRRHLSPACVPGVQWTGWEAEVSAAVAR